MANNPYIQTNFTASDMLGSKKTEPVKAQKPAPKAETASKPSRPSRPAPVVEVKEETTAPVETVVEEVAVEELTKSDEE
jgi:hypothetical protein